MGAKAIAEALGSGNAVLTSLDVGYNKMDEDAALAIVRAAKPRDQMISLGLASCKIGPTGATEIAEYVSVSAVLKTLDLASNYIGPELGSIMADVLTKNAVLTDLNLGNNRIGNNGAKAIAKALGSGKAVLTKLECVSPRTEREPRIASAHAAYPRVRRAAARRTVPVAPAEAPPGRHGASFSAQSARLSERFFPHLPCFRFFASRRPLYFLTSLPCPPPP